MKYSVLLCSVLSIIYGASADNVLSIESGKISGEVNLDFIAYRGIPYAESPVGDLRFAPPKPYAGKWDGVKEFKNFSDACAQYGHLLYEFEGSEGDCLTLNVFVPKKVSQSTEKVPVVVYIHGGAFMFGGAADYGPENFVKSQKMILVTINYRLGILGFLSTEDEVIPGNFGLKDQVEALRWVQRNIGSFNGDSKQVTITGFSAGGASVQLHYMSPLTNGLFNNGISHSGNALDPWVMMENAKQKAHQVAEFMNCPQDHKKLLKCLREKPAKDLVLLAKKFQPFMYNPFSPFGVVVEKSHKTAFLTDSPLKLLSKGKFQKLPWLLSQAQDEGLYPGAEFYDDKILKKINDEWRQLAPLILDFDELTTTEGRKHQMGLKIRQHYLGNAQISKEHFSTFVDILSDRLFKHGAYKAINLMSKHSPCFFYYFRFKAVDGVAEYFSKSKDDIGISHGEDVFLIFDSPTIRKSPYSDGEMTVMKNLVDLYYNFAKYSLPIYSGVQIEKSQPNAVKYLEISESVKTVELDEHFGNGMFWDAIEKVLNSPDRTYYDEL